MSPRKQTLDTIPTPKAPGNLPDSRRGLRAWLFLRGLRLGDVAAEYGCNVVFISRVLSGRKTTTRQTWEKVRRAAARADAIRRRQAGAPADLPQPAQERHDGR